MSYLQHQISDTYKLVAGKVNIESSSIEMKTDLLDLDGEMRISKDLNVRGATFSHAGVFSSKK